MDDFGPFKPPAASASVSASHYDDMFDSYFNRSAEPAEPSPSSSAPSPPRPPVFDKPVFDDDDPDAADPFDAIPLFGDGRGGGSGSGEGEDFLDSLGKGTKPDLSEPEVVGLDDDLLPGLGSSKSKTPVREVEQEVEAAGLVDDLIPEWFGGSTMPMKPVPQAKPEALGFEDDVIPEFGKSTSHHDSPWEEPRTRQEKESISSNKTSVLMPENPFVTLGATSNLGYSSFGLFTDHLDNMGMPTKLDSTKLKNPSTASGMFDNSDIFSRVTKPMPSFSFASDKESVFGENRSLDDIHSTSHSIKISQEKPVQQASAEKVGSILPEMHIHEAPGTNGFNNLDPLSRNMRDQLPEENRCSKMSDDVWLTVSDVVLVTQPTSAPPPSRPPPPLATKQAPTESNTNNTYPYNHNQGYNPFIGSTNTSKTSKFDELDEFVKGKPSNFANGRPQDLNHKVIGLGQDSSTSAAGFKDWAELEHSKGVNQGNFDSMFTSSQYQEKEIDDKAEFYAYEMENRDEEERLEHEKKQREKEEEQRKIEREREEELGREREMMRREQEERKRREKEKEARHAVEKAIREARERAAAEARMRAEREARQRAERAAVQKVAAEARERAAAEARDRAAKAAAEAKERAAEEARERAAKAAAEARERAAAEARERVAKAAAEARERAAAEAREKAAAEARAKAERAAVEKAAAEARRRAERAAVERAAAEARQRAANEARKRAEAEARARENQQKTAQPDLDSFFGVPSRSSSVPRSQTATTNPFDVHPQGGADFGAVRTSSGSASPFTQPPSTNLMDDLSSIFGVPSSSTVFQEVDGESEERRKARLERHQRTMERAAKALAEKNERDLQVQREQEERHRISETLDFEIKRWAAGKEGNLRALLSTLQYVLWPECGWRPVSLTDLITAASVKKEYRKATLCIHPDKVQQKGANLQQKYIAEKVFDLLKEAWNKFNSEELF